MSLNGTDVGLEPPPDGDWKRERGAEVGALLRPGANTIVATVRASFGPPALWLALTADQVSIATDESWQASCAGSATRSARKATTPMSEWAQPTAVASTGALYSDELNPRMIGGSGRIDVRPPWDYELMSAGMVLALVPSLALILGLGLALARLVREPRAGWFIALGLQAGMLAALINLALRLPFYQQAKAFFASQAMIPLCAVIGLGFDALAERVRSLAPLLWTLLGLWALVGFATFWSPSGEALQRLQWRDPELWLWAEKDAGSDARGGLAALERSVARAADSAGAHAQLAIARVQRRDFEGASAAARESLAVDPWNARAHHVLGVALHTTGDPVQALEHFDLAARLDPLALVYVLDLSSVLMDAEDYAAAKTALERAQATLTKAGLAVDPRISERLERCRKQR